MILILSELTLNEMKNIDLYSYLYDGNGFFDLTRGNKKAVIERTEWILNYYRLYSTTPLNITIITDREWENFCPNRFVNSISLSCWKDIPQYIDFTKRLNNADIRWSDEDIAQIVSKISETNFRTAHLNIQLSLS